MRFNTYYRRRRTNINRIVAADKAPVLPNSKVVAKADAKNIKAMIN